MSQTAYNATPNEAYAGLLYDSSLVRDIITRINAAKQLWKVVVTTADDSKDFTITLAGHGIYVHLGCQRHQSGDQRWSEGAHRCWVG